MIESICRWLVRKYGQGQSTFCYCPKCGLQLCHSDCWFASNREDIIRYECIQCGHKSGWLFDVTGPLLVEGRV